jgi:RHS repeat-associated protein
MSDKSRHERNMRCSPSRVATLLGGDLPAGFVRFGYDGGWGYQAGLHVAAPATEADDPLRRTGLLSLYGPRADLPPIALQHVGARWYDPAIGRFVQRDPIGIEGGMNVYLYCGANPITGVDPLGLWKWWFDPESGLSDWVARNYWLRFHSEKYINSTWAPAEAVGVSAVVGASGYFGVTYCVALAQGTAGATWLGWTGSSVVLSSGGRWLMHMGNKIVEWFPPKFSVPVLVRNLPALESRGSPGNCFWGALGAILRAL